MLSYKSSVLRPNFCTRWYVETKKLKSNKLIDDLDDMSMTSSNRMSVNLSINRSVQEQTLQYAAQSTILSVIRCYPNLFNIVWFDYDQVKSHPLLRHVQHLSIGTEVRCTVGYIRAKYTLKSLRCQSDMLSRLIRAGQTQLLCLDCENFSDPQYLTRLTKLQTLYCGTDCEKYDYQEYLALLTKLQTPHCGTNCADKRFVESIACLTQLVRLRCVGSISIDDATIGGLTDLTFLDCSYCPNVMGRTLHRLTDLSTLVCEGSMIDCCVIERSTQLRTLDVTGALKMTERSLSRLTNLQCLGCDLPIDIIRKIVSSLPKLERIIYRDHTIVRSRIATFEPSNHHMKGVLINTCIDSGSAIISNFGVVMHYSPDPDYASVGCDAIRYQDDRDVMGLVLPEGSMHEVLRHATIRQPMSDRLMREQYGTMIIDNNESSHLIVADIESINCAYQWDDRTVVFIGCMTVDDVTQRIVMVVENNRLIACIGISGTQTKFPDYPLYRSVPETGVYVQPSNKLLIVERFLIDCVESTIVLNLTNFHRTQSTETVNNDDEEYEIDRALVLISATDPDKTVHVVPYNSPYYHMTMYNYTQCFPRKGSYGPGAIVNRSIHTCAPCIRNNEMIDRILKSIDRRNMYRMVGSLNGRLIEFLWKWSTGRYVMVLGHDYTSHSRPSWYYKYIVVENHRIVVCVDDLDASYQLGDVATEGYILSDDVFVCTNYGDVESQVVIRRLDQPIS